MLLIGRVKHLALTLRRILAAQCSRAACALMRGGGAAARRRGSEECTRCEEER